MDAIEYNKTDLIYYFAQSVKPYLDSKEIIYHTYKNGMSRAERVATIAREYGRGGTCSAQAFIRRIICGYAYDGDGVKLRYRDKFGKLHEIAATWDDVEAAIEKAINAGEYFNDNLT